MPLRTVPGTDAEYFLVCYDADGVERPEPDGSRLSDAVRARVAAGGVTDVFFTSHGWKGDVPGAIAQYDAWVGATVALEADRARARQRRPGFSALVVGVHWPSLPWGDETPDASGSPGLLSADAAGVRGGETVDAYAERIADTPAARAALAAIFAAADRGVGPAPDGSLPADVRAAYGTLFAESGLGTAGRDVGGGAPPGADQDAFDPEAMIRELQAAPPMAATGAPMLLGDGFFDRLRDLLLTPVRQLSFWKMKDRAHVVGESGAHALLAALERAAPASTRFHLMGHSFGCIVVTAAVAGPPGGPGLPRPVHSLFLVQGALSLWAYTPDVPYAPGTPGYFARIVAEGLVAGPIVTTRSTFDTAVGRFYPLGARARGDVVLADDLPKYGGVGAFGIRGLDGVAEDLPMQGAAYPYAFGAGRIYNLEASGVIRAMDGLSGAHSDIAHPEVAHAFWAGVLADEGG